MDLNPYESPRSTSTGLDSGQDSALSVEGRCLVVPEEIVLPPFCVRTNEPVSESDMVRKNFYWCSPWVALLIVISGCLVVLAYFLVRKRLTITYGLAPQLRAKYRKRFLGKMAAALGLFLMLPVASAFDPPWMGWATFVLFIVMVVWLPFGNGPLSVAAYRRDRFWVKGCCDTYLARIEWGDHGGGLPP